MKTITYILTILILLLFNQKLEACSCVGERPVKEAIERVDAVFTGTIIEKEEIRIYDTLSHDQRVYRVEMKYKIAVETVYKGQSLSDTSLIFTGRGGGDCGYNFQIGQKYIVYAGHIETDERYSGQVFIDKKSAFRTTICTRTRKYQTEEIKEIEKHTKQNKLRRKK